jgi:hypothetical protein
VKIGLTTRPYVRVLVMVVALTIVAGTTGAAERWAVRTIAEILLTFEHSPSCADRAVVRKILNDEATTHRERVVATALLNVRHIPQAVDARALEAVLIDQSTPLPLRTVATAIVNLTHTVTDADRRALHALLK